MRKVSMATRAELILAIRGRYASAGRPEKAKILDEFVALTGFHRKHAMRLLRGSDEPAKGGARPGRRIYGDAVRAALVLAWEASDRICGKRLHPLLPLLIEAMERHGHGGLDDQKRQQLLAMSAATIDRILKGVRASAAGQRRRKGSTAIRRSVPVRTFSDWNNPAPGFVEADLVAHSGPFAKGAFTQTLVLTDIATGWTECAPLLVREQGGPLSPLLSNLVLDELDRELEHRGHRFVRYADDCNIYVRSERAGQRVMESISRFITQKLKLKVNEAKSAVARPQERKFLGFSFAAGPDIKRTIAPKSLERFKQRIRDITRRAKGVSIKTTMEELAQYMRGWRGYFGFCETPEVLIALTRWVRLRLRAALWRQWKTPGRRRAALIALGVSGELRNMAGSGRGPWHLARSKALSVALSNAHFKSLGFLSLTEAR